MPPAVPPRQPGESRYAYSNRRSLALTGKSLYQRRVESGLASGLSRREARGHGGGLTEYQRRNLRSVEQTGLTLYQRRIQAIDSWLSQNGFTPVTTGLSWTALRRIQPRLKWINENTSPGGRLTPDMILERTDMEKLGTIERGWVTDHVFKRYEAMYEFQVNGNRAPGNFYWFNEGGSDEPRETAQWWYYH